MILTPVVLHADIDRIRLVRTLIDKHFDSPLTLDQMGRTAGFSRFHFIRVFRDTYKTTPHQYLVARRIERAKHLLRHSEMSITDVCVEVGFSSLGSFSTLFRKATGLSPSSYREHACRTPQPRYMPLCHMVKHDVRDPESL